MEIFREGGHSSIMDNGDDMPLGSSARNHNNNTENKKTTNPVKRRPCDFCRKRKAKCEFGENDNMTCLSCLRRSRECTFSLPPLVKRTRVVEGEATEHNSTNHSVATERELILSQDYSEMKGPSLLKRTLGLQNSRCSFYIGPTNMLDYSVLSRAQFNSHDESDKGLPVGTRLRRGSDDAIFFMEVDNRISPSRNISQDQDAIEALVAPYGKALIELYFRIIHPAYPILHKKVVLEKYARSYKEFSPPLLAAIYSLALSWWAYSPNLPLDKKPPNAEEQLDKLALATFNEVIKRPKLSGVQAGLLILHKSKGKGNINSQSSVGSNDEGAWPLVSQLVGLAEELGLNLDCSDWNIPRWEKKLRRRLAWAVYIQDKWGALAYSRPSHISIQSGNWIVAPLVDDDFPDKPPDEHYEIEGSSDIVGGKLVFQYMVSLTQILDDILSTLYTPLAMSQIVDTMEILELCHPLQERLRAWSRSLPEAIRMWTIKRRKFCSNGYLYLAYLAAEITLHRRIIHSLSTYHTPADLYQVCRSAAKERLVVALDFARDLRPEHVQSFWHSSAMSNFALIGTFASLLWATSTDPEEQEFLETSLKNYRWMFRVSSVGSEQVTAAVRKLDLVTSFLPFMKEAFTYEPSQLPSSDSEISDYEDSSRPSI